MHDAAVARNAVAEIACYRDFDYIIVNDDLDTAYAEIATVIGAHELTRQSRGHIAEAMIEKYDKETGR